MLKQLPLELLELLIFRSFIVLFLRHYDRHCQPDSASAAYRTLAGVCGDWWQTLNGWPQSDTRQWLRHKLQRTVNKICRPYRRLPLLVKQLTLDSTDMSLAFMDDKLFAIYSLSHTIQVFGWNNERFPGIEVDGLEWPRGIVACHETKSLYVADERPSFFEPGCVWRVSLDGNVSKFVPNQSTTMLISPNSLSVTSGRLLVISDDCLVLCSADGVQLKAVSLPQRGINHAVETKRDTFVFSAMIPKPRVYEVDAEGRVIRFYEYERLKFPCKFACDRYQRMFVSDFLGRQVLLLDSELRLERVLLNNEGDLLVYHPCALCYVHKTRQLIIHGAFCFDLQVFLIQ